jgi:hypothetical protein
MEYVRNKIMTIEEQADSEQSNNKHYTNIYHLMCVKQDFTNGINAEVYKLEELALEVV